MKRGNRSIVSILIGLAGLMVAAADCAAQDAPAAMLPLAEIDRCGIRIVPFVRDSRVVIELQYGVSWDRKTLDRLRGTNGFAELQLEYCVKNSRSEVVWDNRRHEYIDPFAVSDSTLLFYAGLLKRPLVPDDYTIICTLVNLETGGSLRRSRYVHCPELPSPTLYVSDIMLASSVSPGRPAAGSAFAKGDCTVHPYPFETVPRTYPVFLYFEIDHLALKKRSGALYTVTYNLEQHRRSIPLLSRAGSAIGSEYSAACMKTNAQEFFAFDLTHVTAGRYRVRVTVTDEVADETAETGITFRVVD
ncbi:hypothetical protein JXO52_07700 [bacterium]|nr:hypothetical protein [bacterium]